MTSLDFTLRDPLGGDSFGGGDGWPVVPEASPGIAIGTAVFKELLGAYAGFTAVRTNRVALGMERDYQQHVATMADLDRRNAERRAQSILEQGQSEIANLTMEGGQRRGAARATTAARGIVVGTGSAEDAERSDKAIEALDVYHINLAAVREANAARAEAVGAGNRALFARTSARNMRRAAKATSPEGQLFAGLLSAGIEGARVGSYRRR